MMLRRVLILVLATLNLLGLASNYVLAALCAGVEEPQGLAAPLVVDLGYYVILGIGLASFAIVGVLLVWRRSLRGVVEETLRPASVSVWPR
jgi:hypothetical protein